MSDDAGRGGAIREARKSKGLTQEHLGELVGVTPQAVSKWENGESAPDINTVPLLCDVLGISADEFLRGRGAQGQAPDPLVKGFREWLQQHRQRHGFAPSLTAIFHQLVAAVREGGESLWQGDVLMVRLADDRRPSGVTLLTREGSVLHWAGTGDLPDPDISDDAIADAMKWLADPEIIGILRRLLSGSTSSCSAGSREHAGYSRLLQEGYMSYHESVDGAEFIPRPRGLTVAAILLLLAAVLGLGNQQKGRGLNFTGMSTG